MLKESTNWMHKTSFCPEVDLGTVLNRVSSFFFSPVCIDVLLNWRKILRWRLQGSYNCSFYFLFYKVKMQTQCFALKFVTWVAKLSSQSSFTILRGIYLLLSLVVVELKRPLGASIISHTSHTKSMSSAYSCRRMNCYCITATEIWLATCKPYRGIFKRVCGWPSNFDSVWLLPTGFDTVTAPGKAKLHGQTSCLCLWIHSVFLILFAGSFSKLYLFLAYWDDNIAKPAA